MTCIIRSLLGFPCPTCGVTRAMLSLLRGDFATYCHYNILAVPLCLAFLMAMYGTKKNKDALVVIGIVILVLNFPYYIYRFYYGLIP